MRLNFRRIIAVSAVMAVALSMNLPVASATDELAELSVTDPEDQAFSDGPLTLDVDIDPGYDGVLEYASTDPEVCTVDDGVVTFVGLGTCEITVTAPETTTYAADTDTVSFEILSDGEDAELSVTDPGDQAFSDDPLTLEVVFAVGYDGVLEYLSTDLEVCTVVGGVVTFVGLGTCEITVTAPETTTYAEDTDTVSFEILSDGEDGDGDGGGSPPPPATTPVPVVAPVVVTTPQPVPTVVAPVVVPSLLSPVAGRPVNIATPPQVGVATSAAIAVKGRQVTLALTAPVGGKVTQYVIVFRDRVTGKKFTVTRNATGGEVSRGRIQLPRGKYQMTVQAKLRNGKIRSWSGQNLKVGK